MSKILQMQSVPVLNGTDLYQHFDVLDMLRGREAFARLANGHFRWSGSINLHHLDVILAMTDGNMKYQMKSAADYWAFQGVWSAKLLEPLERYEELPQYREQAETAALIYRKYAPKLRENDSKIIMLVTAGVLLSGKDGDCLAKISAEQLKKAYERADHDSEESDGDEAVFTIRFDSGHSAVTLPSFHGTYQFSMDSALRPSREKRLQTYVIHADADVNLEFTDRGTGKARQCRLLTGERMYALGIDGIISRILPNRVVNGENEMVRGADGIYLNGRKCTAIPDDVSSFAVGMSRGVPRFIYVRDGHIHYGSYDNLEGMRKVSEEIAVICEVRIEGSKVTVLRNDGKIWDGKQFC